MRASHTSPGVRGLGESAHCHRRRGVDPHAHPKRACAVSVGAAPPRAGPHAGWQPPLGSWWWWVSSLPAGAWPHLPLVARHLLPREEVGALPQQVLQPQLARLSVGLAHILHQVL